MGFLIAIIAFLGLIFLAVALGRKYFWILIGTLIFGGFMACIIVG